MSEMTLTIVDTVGIQDYLFASNRLRENLGASELVERAVRDWVREALPTPHNLDHSGAIIAARRIEEDATLDAEVLLQGGGNALIVFRSRAVAVEAIQRLSERLLTDAPGLGIAVAHQPFSWDKPLGGPDGALARLYKGLARAKQVRSGGAPLLGQGVTLECRSTGLPAVAMARAQGDDDPARPASADVMARIDKGVIEGARERLKRILPEEVIRQYALPDRFDDLGRSEGVQSYIAVVHADGNGIGRRFAELTREPGDNRQQIDGLRALSTAVNAAGELALRRTVETMARAFASPERRAPDDPIKLFLAGLPEERKSAKSYLPFRPIVYGGDDVTFVCDGRLGLSLAAEYLRQFHAATTDVGLPGGAAHACAGVAIVKTHYPFARAYSLAEELCDQAKRQLRKAGRDESVLDWHFALSGLLAELEDLREREYHSEQKKPLTMRPLTVFGPGFHAGWRTLPAFEGLVHTLQNDKLWRERRSKLKELREVLRQGPTAVQTFCRAARIDALPLLPGASAELSRSGWEGDQCGYFDAIEALDFIIPLQQVDDALLSDHPAQE